MLTAFQLTRSFRYYTLLAAALLTLCLAGCQSAPAVPPTPARPLITATPIPPTETATPRPSPTVRATAVPTITFTPNPNAIRLDNMFTNLRSSEIYFVAYLTPTAAKIKTAQVDWTFEKSRQTGQKAAILPPQEVGKTVKLDVSILLDQLPIAESTLTYHWTFRDDFGNPLVTKDGRFKLTEATRSDTRDDLPIIAAKQTFQSKFPDEAVFTVSVKPDNPITNARFFITQNRGVVVEDYEARINNLEKGEMLLASYTWSRLLALQIPWQEFETWWVFTDAFGKVFRTEHALNDYTDKAHRWKKTPTKSAVLYTYDLTAANLGILVAATDKSIETLENEFDYKLLYKPHIVVYNSTKDFRDWAQGFEEAGFIGMANGKWGGAVVAVYSSIRYTGYSIIKHELAHLFQFQSIQRELAQWFIEGSARYFEDFPEQDGEAVVRQYVRGFAPPSLLSAVPYISNDKKIVGLPYYVGMTFIKYMRATYGADSFAKVHLALARNMELTDAMKFATGKTLDQLDKEWAKWITQ